MWIGTLQRASGVEVITVILNLDPKSSNAYTMSLFREGARIAEPQPIPQCLSLRFWQSYVDVAKTHGTILG